jgi:hypothetical protein
MEASLEVCPGRVLRALVKKRSASVSVASRSTERNGAGSPRACRRWYGDYQRVGIMLEKYPE